MKLLTLEEISRKNITLLDTNIISSNLPGNRRPISQKSILELQEGVNYYTELLDLSKKGHNIYITNGIFNESRAFADYLITNSSKNGSRGRKNELGRKNQSLRSQIFNLLEDKGKIIKLNEGETIEYELFDQACQQIKNHYGLSNIDWDFLLSGLVMSRNRGNVSLISNDNGIVESWRAFIACECVNPYVLNFFSRKEIHSFVSRSPDQRRFQISEKSYS